MTANKRIAWIRLLGLGAGVGGLILLGLIVARNRRFEAGAGWEREPPEYIPHSEWHRVPQEDWSAVLDDRYWEALRLLDEAPAVDLSSRAAEHFVGPVSPKGADYKPYSVRGLSLQANHVNRMVRVRNNAVWVYYGALAQLPVRVVKAPIVVWLGFKPEDVYVSGTAVP
jgi:hypothetical protein